MKNKNGFTLVELIAVIVILVLLMVMAFFITTRNVEKSVTQALIKDALTFQRGALSKYNTDKLENKTSDNVFHNNINGKVCYTIRHDLSKYVSSGNKKIHGSVEVCYGLECNYESKIWLTDGTYYIDGETNPNGLDDLKNSFSTDFPDSCGVDAIGGGTSGDLYTAEFDYTGSEQIMGIITPGRYTIEAWGASGGEMDSINGVYTGGLGGYSHIEVDLKKDDVLYINVGGEGSSNCGSDECPGGYNGGGAGSSTVASGGGATSVSLSSGLLTNENNNDKNVLIIAGGGGGASSSANGYNAGGACSQASGVCQTGTYGIGTNSSGGGYRVGTTLQDGVGRGGSGYVGKKKKAYNGYMYCVGCPSNSTEYSITYVAGSNDFSKNAVSKKAKIGNGYVRISLESKKNEVTQGILATDFPDYLRLEYVATSGSQYFDTEYNAKSNSGYYLKEKYIGFYNPGYMFGASSSNASIGQSVAFFTQGWQSCGGNSYAFVLKDGAASTNLTGVQAHCIDFPRTINLNVESGKFDIDNAYRTTISTLPTADATKSIYLSANNNNGNVEYFVAMEIYDFKIYENGTEVKHFIPCVRKTDNEAGLCELHTKKFHTNKGNGSLIKGPINNT